MKKNAANPIRRFINCFGAWVHLVIEKKGAHIEACGWYPGPMSN